jgi:SAM-dependent methyltransferase
MMPCYPVIHRFDSHRSSFQGVWQILRFNYPMFVVAGALAPAGWIVLACVTVPWAIAYPLAALLSLGIFWAASTLAVSHLMYDRYPLFAFQWIPAPLPDRIHFWVNIHAGFDQTTLQLRKAFAGTCGVAVDLFTPEVMTERSIHRARRSLPRVPGTVQASFDNLPMPAASVDSVFLIFAAHELRSHEQRSALFREAARILALGGTLVLVEHLRGLPNLLAFGPGVFHFFSQKQWLHAAENISIHLVAQVPLTPFATAFIWRKQP